MIVLFNQRINQMTGIFILEIFFVIFGSYVCFCLLHFIYPISNFSVTFLQYS